MDASTILLVDDDEVLSQVLRRVLTRQGYNVVNANNVAQAVQLAKEHPPQLGLLDLCLPDGDGLELAHRLSEQCDNLPLILLTAYPLRLRDRPELASRFSRILTKPVNLQELRDAIEAALHEPKTPVSASAQVALPIDATAQPRQEPVMTTAAAPVYTTAPASTPQSRRWIGVTIGVIAACILVLVISGWSFGWYHALPGFAATAAEPRTEEPSQVSAVPGNPNAIAVTEDVIKRLKIDTAEVKKATAHRPLELSGTLGFETDKQSRLRSRFAGELIEIADAPPPSAPPLDKRDAEGRTLPYPPPRPLRIGDEVKGPYVTPDGKKVPGTLLGVVWSSDFGQKKSDLVDALSQLTADEAFLKKYDTLDRGGFVPEFTILQQRRNTEQSRIAVQRAENSLRTAKMSDDEIKALEQELRELAAKPLSQEERSKVKEWARVELRAPFDGWIVEKNVNPGDIVDTATDLFKITNLRRLIVWANVREEDLPTLLDKELPIDWKISLSNVPKTEEKPLDSKIVYISPQVDPTQHVALAMGYLDNTDLRLRSAQFITAKVQFPDPKQMVAIPTEALIEDGNSKIVFVQPDPKKHEYVMKRVKVVYRYSDVIQISNNLTVNEAKPIEQGGEGLETLKEGEKVVIQNALGMKAALDDLNSKSKDKN